MFAVLLKSTSWKGGILAAMFIPCKNTVRFVDASTTKRELTASVGKAVAVARAAADHVRVADLVAKVEVVRPDVVLVLVLVVE
ncbi:hypothetical protein HK405_013309, partial [Cladochytrium tenue]